MPSAAETYFSALSALDQSPNAAEPEAQLTRPVADFLEQFCAEASFGALLLQREAQLVGVRPDFAALIEGRPCGWVELKAPGHSVDGPTWRGRERTQWARLSELDSLLVTNGDTVRLYRLGEQVGEDVSLPSNGAAGWDRAPLETLMQMFLVMRPPVIQTVHQLAERLAPVAKLLRERVLAGLDVDPPRPLIVQAKAAWAANVHEGVSDQVFASDLAQVVSYSLAIAALGGAADSNADGFVSLSEARQTLRSSNAVLAASLGPVLEIAGLADELASEIGAIERLVSSLNPSAVAASQDPRGEPWLWFYEDFLAAYDPAARERAGVYYTPTAIVQMQVRHMSHVLIEKLGKRLGFADRNVVTLDPATGSGTYPLAVLDMAAATATAARGAAGPRQVIRHLVENVLAFEILPGPYAVAHLRIGRRLAELDHSLVPPGNVRVYLTDTLDDPNTVPAQLPLWGDVQVLAEERERARTVKHDQPVTAILGNPPYERGTRRDGGWLVNAPGRRALFADVLEPAQAAGIIFSEQASLYNQYVYFWRWAFWKAFEQDPNRSAAVSFITASSWINNPVFVGLRELALKHADEIWITDLGGEGRGTNVEDNVFDIQTPVAIVTMYRRGAPSGTTAKVSYTRIEGTRAEKLNALGVLPPPDVDGALWQSHLPTAALGFIPPRPRDTWDTYPRLIDLFPWQTPGVKVNRTWPFAPDRGVLRQRWNQLLADPAADERAKKFAAGASGRTIHTQVTGLTKLSELPVGAPPRKIKRYSFRSFDRQWIIEDPRLINLERPALWASLSDAQIYLSTMVRNPLGDGPGATVATSPPDLHHFRGSYGGKDVIPLYRDSSALIPNVTAGLLERLPSVDGAQATVEDLLGYVFGILGNPNYVSRFASELREPGPRVPITKDPELFAAVRDAGHRLLWLQTFGERFRTDSRTADLPSIESLGWTEPVSRLPRDEEIVFDADLREVRIADGVLGGVSQEAWEFTVSGWPVIRRWIEARSALGRGFARTRPQPLDETRPTVWLDEWNDELLEVVTAITATLHDQDRLNELLDEVIRSEIIAPDDLPVPTRAERSDPR